MSDFFSIHLHNHVYFQEGGQNFFVNDSFVLDRSVFVIIKTIRSTNGNF